jgi:UDP-N-acetylmuramate--alanine ligase
VLFNPSKPIHFIGIGGISMAPVALLYRKLGYAIQGSDNSENNNYVPLLKRLQVKVVSAHAAANLEGIQHVVYSSAIKPGFPEYDWAAADPEITLVHRSQAVWDLFGRKAIVIAVTGSHGKTSTTAMLTQMLRASKGEFSDPSFLIGGRMDQADTWESSAHLGASPISVIEADESDASFLNYHPTYSLITSIEVDHLDRFSSRENFDQAFVKFMAQVERDNFLCAEDAGVQGLMPAIQSAHIPYQLYGLTDFPSDSAADFDIEELSFFGQHNLLNAAGASAVARTLGLDDQIIQRGLISYRPPQRRLQYLGEYQGIKIVDDYAHHPTEIAVSLQAMRERFPGRRIIALFQPHLYSRTRFFQKEFAEALTAADRVIITGIYAARESDPGDVNSATIKDLNPDFDNFEDKFVAAAYARSLARPGDLIAVLGAGDIWQIIPQLKL